MKTNTYYNLRHMTCTLWFICETKCVYSLNVRSNKNTHYDFIYFQAVNKTDYYVYILWLVLIHLNQWNILAEK